MADEHLIGTLRLDLAFPDPVRTDQALPDADRLAAEVIVPVLETVTREYDGVDITLDQLEINLGSVTEEELPGALEWALRNELDRRRGSGFRPFLPDADAGIDVTVDAPVPSPFAPGTALPSPVDQLMDFLSRFAVPWDDDVRTFDPVALFDRAMSSLAPEEAPMDVPSDIPAATPPAIAAFVSRLLPFQTLRLAELARRSDRFPEVLELVESPVLETDQPQPPGIPWQLRMKAELSSRMAAREASWRAYRGIRSAKASPGASSVDIPSALSSGKQASIGRETPWKAGVDETSADFPEVVWEVSLVEDPSPEESERDHPDRIPLPEDRPGEARPVASPPEAAASERPETVIPEPDAPSAQVDEAEVRQPNVAPSSEILAPDPGSQAAIPPVDSEDAASSPSDAVWEAAPEESEAAPERIPISDAGLVLIHPFITRFLQNMGLVDRKGRFVSGEARVHAVHLLRHVTGYDDPHLGHRLVLEKVLCGLPVDYLVPEDWEATPEEEEEVEGMLTSLLSHWPTLSKSSVGALQRSFLQRPGEIAQVDGSSVIRVEGSALDILMHDLPWENSIILLSWLDKPIFVEWQK